jgi:hypothetical protein
MVLILPRESPDLVQDKFLSKLWSGPGGNEGTILNGGGRASATPRKESMSTPRTIDPEKEQTAC